MEKEVNKKTLYNQIKQLAPDTIMDAGSIVVKVKLHGYHSYQLRILETDLVEIKDGKVTIFRSKDEQWEVMMAGQYGPSGKPIGNKEAPKKKATKKKTAKKKKAVKKK